jgi:hypothetical protein
MSASWGSRPLRCSRHTHTARQVAHLPWALPRTRTTREPTVDARRIGLGVNDNRAHRQTLARRRRRAGSRPRPHRPHRPQHPYRRHRPLRPRLPRRRSPSPHHPGRARRPQSPQAAIHSAPAFVSQSRPDSFLRYPFVSPCQPLPAGNLSPRRRQYTQPSPAAAPPRIPHRAAPTAQGPRRLAYPPARMPRNGPAGATRRLRRRPRPRTSRWRRGRASDARRRGRPRR